MKVIFPGSNKKEVAMVVRVRSAADALKIAEQPATGNHKPTIERRLPSPPLAGGEKGEGDPIGWSTASAGWNRPTVPGPACRDARHHGAGRSSGSSFSTKLETFRRCVVMHLLGGGFGPSRNCSATRTPARPWSTLMSSTKEAEECGAPSTGCESFYTNCISRRPSGRRQRRFYGISVA